MIAHVRHNSATTEFSPSEPFAQGLRGWGVPFCLGFKGPLKGPIRVPLKGAIRVPLKGSIGVN